MGIQTLLAIMSAVLQLFYLLALFHFASGLYGAAQLISSSDPKLISGAIAAGTVKSLIPIMPALIGIIIGIFLVRSSNKPPIWFLKFCRKMSYLWLLFFPLGTLLGVLQLRQLRHAI